MLRNTAEIPVRIPQGTILDTQSYRWYDGVIGPSGMYGGKITIPKLYKYKMTGIWGEYHVEYTFISFTPMNTSTLLHNGNGVTLYPVRTKRIHRTGYPFGKVPSDARSVQTIKLLLYKMKGDTNVEYRLMDDIDMLASMNQISYIGQLETDIVDEQFVNILSNEDLYQLLECTDIVEDPIRSTLFGINNTLKRHKVDPIQLLSRNGMINSADLRKHLDLNYTGYLEFMLSPTQQDPDDYIYNWPNDDISLDLYMNLMSALMTSFASDLRIVSNKKETVTIEARHSSINVAAGRDLIKITPYPDLSVSMALQRLREYTGFDELCLFKNWADEVILEIENNINTIAHSYIKLYTDLSVLCLVSHAIKKKGETT